MPNNSASPVGIVREISRRALFRRTAWAAAAALGWFTLRSAAAQQKLTQKQAKYQDHPKGQQRCEICVNFQPPSQCRIVEGPISKTGWCQFFAAKENAH